MTRAAVVGLALAGGGLLWVAIPASADTGDSTGAGGPTSAAGDLGGTTGPITPANDLTPAGVPVAGLVTSVTGATKALPGSGGQNGPGY